MAYHYAMKALCCVLLFFTLQNLRASELYLVEDKTRTWSAEQAYQNFLQKDSRVLPGKKLNAGLTESIFWMIIQVSPAGKKDHLNIDNPHINVLELYRLEGNSFEKIGTTGDHFSFRQRLFWAPTFVFPLRVSDKEAATYLLRIDKHEESLSFTAKLLSMDELYKAASQSNLINGVLGGILSIIVLFGLFLFISTRDLLYLYYILYILAAIFWVLTDEGYSFQYFWPESPYIASRARLLTILFFCICLIQFVQAFLSQHRGDRFFKPLKAIQWLNFVFLILALIVPYSAAQSSNVIFIFLFFNIFLVTITVLLIALSIRDKIRLGNHLAWFYLFSVLALLAFIFTEIFVQAGVNSEHLLLLQKYGIQTGIVVEAIILNFGLAHRFNQYKNEKEQLLVQRNLKQEELSNRILETQEEERKTIAEQLHDDVGSMLSLVSIQISSVLQESLPLASTQKLTKASEVLQSVSASIRNMSHSLTPIAIEKYGLANALNDLSSTISLSGKIKSECIIVGFDTESKISADLNMLNEIYRITRELLNNILKHAQASHCLIQLIEHPEAISLMVEDNGTGFKPDQLNISTGIGIRNIQSRIAYLKGTLEISLRPEGGTLIVIEIPIR